VVYQNGNGSEEECATTINDCPFSANKYADGFCDDEMNIAECGFDGQDCCKDVLLDYFCFTCACIPSLCSDICKYIY
jgi:hypothetical protein